MSRSTDQIFVKFAVQWKIEWADFDQLRDQSMTKSFITAFRNIPFYWRAQLYTEGNDARDWLFFCLLYEDGPERALKDIGYTLKITQPGSPNSDTNDTGKWETNRGNRWGYLYFGHRNAQCFREKYNLTITEPLYCQITLKIPISVFSYPLQNPLAGVESSGRLLEDLFEKIDDFERTPFSNAKLISNEGKIFYCDKVVIGSQSTELAAMLRHPTAENPIDGVYVFPKLSTSALKTMIEYLYTTKTSFDDLSTKALIEVIDAAEQYRLEQLKMACAVFLWTRVVEKPEDAFDVIRFASVHQDMHYLKHRALDVVAENFETFSLQDVNNLTQKFGGDHALIVEFCYYMHRRVKLDFS